MLLCYVYGIKILNLRILNSRKNPLWAKLQLRPGVWANLRTYRVDDEPRLVRPSKNIDIPILDPPKSMFFLRISIIFLKNSNNKMVY